MSCRGHEDRLRSYPGDSLEWEDDHTFGECPAIEAYSPISASALLAELAEADAERVRVPVGPKRTER